MGRECATGARAKHGEQQVLRSNGIVMELAKRFVLHEREHTLGAVVIQVEASGHGATVMVGSPASAGLADLRPTDFAC